MSIGTRLAHLMGEREAQHRRYGRLLHDQIAPTLSAAGLQLDALRMDLSDRVPGIAERTVEIQETLEKAMVLIRDLTREMNPSIVDRAGLAYALERRVERLRDEFEGRIRFKYQTAIRPPAEIATSLYRIAEIALDNAVRHSRAKKIELAVNGSRALILQVKDDGRGFHAVRERKSPRGVGLLMMEAYARQAGLQLGIESETRTGTIVRCRYAV